MMEQNQASQHIERDERHPAGQSQTGNPFEKDELCQGDACDTDQNKMFQDQGRGQRQRQDTKK